MMLLKIDATGWRKWRNFPPNNVWNHFADVMPESGLVKSILAGGWGANHHIMLHSQPYLVLTLQVNAGA